MTAKEILQALESNRHQTERMAVFLRDITDLSDFDAKSKSKFKDDTEDEVEPLLTELRTMMEQTLPATNTFYYRVRSTCMLQRPVHVFSLRFDGWIHRTEQDI